MGNKGIVEILNADSQEGRQRLSALSGRQLELPEEIEEGVKEILARVRAEGDEALCHYTSRFDCKDFRPEQIKVPEEEIQGAFEMLDPGLLGALKRARDNIEAFHEKQLPKSWFETSPDGTILGQMVRPVDAAGLYVPGGKGGSTPLVSSVLMNGIPARIAGVSRIVLCTPPGPDGRVNPALLAAADLAGIHEVYRVGSAWAIAAMAYGTETIRPVDVIAGPGNIFVTVAKKLVAGVVGIDMIAGPSEILIIADEGADPRHLAADMLSQAEHDPMATSIMLTTSETLAKATVSALEEQLSSLERQEIASKALSSNGFILVVRDLDQACDIANAIGPEHLELMVNEPWSLVPSLNHAGAIFLGAYSPEPVGDYMAGPNHVLPTMGTARFSSALGVETFLKRSSLIYYSKSGFLSCAQDIVRLAEVEGLTAHARSVQVRLEDKG